MRLLGKWLTENTDSQIRNECTLQFALKRPGMNSGSDRSIAERAPKQRAQRSWLVSGWYSSQPNREPAQPLLTGYGSDDDWFNHWLKMQISWRLLKIENQLLPPIPWPLPPACAGGRGTFFCGILQAGYARLQKTNFFSPSPTASAPLGRGQGVGQKLQLTKVHPSPSNYLMPG